MNNSILLAANMIIIAVVIALVLLVGAGVVVLVIHENNRKKRARERAAERKKIREEALRRAKSGAPNPFEQSTLTPLPSSAAMQMREAQPQQAAVPQMAPQEAPVPVPQEPMTPMPEARPLTKAEQRMADLNTLRMVRENPNDQEMAETMSQRFSTAKITIPEEAKQPQQPQMAPMPAPQMAPMPAPMPQMMPQAAPMPTPQPVPQAAPAPVVKEEVIAAPAPVPAPEPVKEEVILPAEEEVPAADPVSDELKALEEEEARARAEFERLQMEARRKREMILARQKAQMDEQQAMEQERLAQEEAARKAAEEAAMKAAAEEAARIAAEEAARKAAEEAAKAEPVFVPYKDEMGELADAYEKKQLRDSYARESVKEEEIPQVTIPAGIFEAPAEEIQEIPVEVPVYVPQTNIAAPVEEISEVSEIDNWLTDNRETAVEESVPAETASFETVRLTEEEKAAARDARMAEKARFAAALAGEIEIEEIDEKEDPIDEDEDEYEDEDEEENSGKGGRIFLWILVVILALICIGSVVYLFFGDSLPFGNKETAENSVQSTEQVETSADSSDDNSIIIEASSEISEESSENSGEESIEESSEPEDPPAPVFTTFCEEPHYTENTDPANFGATWVKADTGEIVEEYEREYPISFGFPDQYTEMKGITTFRGNNFRDNPVYGDVNVTEGLFSATSVWNRSIGSLPASDSGSWTGCGWTGQPIIVEWDPETRQIMNLYESKKQKDHLVEVIYATLDGNIYFYDLEDGTYTRDPLYIGMAFKGAGALDPRGIPLFYVGSGDFTEGGAAPRMYIISLVENKVLYTAGTNDTIALRGWPAFDSSPIVNAKTDTLIWPGENGVFYTINLHTEYSKTEGTLSVDPTIVKMRYNTSRNAYTTYFYGMEDSVCCFDHYAYIAENGGHFFCIDLNTMDIVWVQDTRDDNNSTPVFEFDETTGRGYLYTAPSLRFKASNGEGDVPIYKLDAITGEIIWVDWYHCATVAGVSGGVESSPAIGRVGSDLEGMIFYTIARCGGTYSGKLVALDTETGEEIWCYNMGNYTWSSPVCVYNAEGHGYIIMFDSTGNGFMVDGVTGEVVDTCSVGWLVEASPAVFQNRLVVGTRGNKVYCLELR